MEKLVGIDFGACNIKTANWRGDRAHVLSLSQNVDQDYIPNIVLYDLTRAGELEKKIGDSAKAEQDPNNSVEYVKRKLELEDWSQMIPNLKRNVSAIEVATDIFDGLSEKLQKKLSCQRDELHSVITVPVCSSGLQRSRIYQAAKATGISVESIITESFAAVFSLEELFDDSDKDETVLIFDFGGSTLDLSLLRIECDDGIRVEELASAGLPYGGIDIDDAILSEIIETKYSSEIAEIRSHDDTMDQSKTMQELRYVATNLKEKLFEDDDESIRRAFTFYGSGQHYEFELTLQEMTELFQRHELKRKIFDLLDELFDQTYVKKEEVTIVKPFGGTSRIKYVLDSLTEYFGSDIFDSDEYEFEDDSLADVAAGAAHYLGICRKSDSNIEIISKIPFSLGIAKGNFFKKYIDCAPPYGRRTKRIPLPWQELIEDGYKVSVYQSFADSDNVKIDGNDGAVYVGGAIVNPELYQSKDGILLEMELKDSNTILMIFSEMRDSELQEVETQVIDLKATES